VLPDIAGALIAGVALVGVSRLVRGGNASR
jgi:hypothetical protein